MSNVLNKINHALEACRRLDENLWSIDSARWAERMNPDLVEEIKLHIETLELKVMHTETAQAAPAPQSEQQEPTLPRLRADYEARIDAYIEDYELLGEDDSGAECCYTPNELERTVLKDAFMGFDFREVFATPAPQPEQREHYCHETDTMCGKCKDHCEAAPTPQPERKPYDTSQFSNLSNQAHGFDSAPAPQPAQTESVRPDVLEKLTYHKLERNDLTLENCLTYLQTGGWHKVLGRTDRQMVLQITELLAAAPAPQPEQREPVAWREDIKVLADMYAAKCSEFARSLALAKDDGSMSPVCAAAGDARMALHAAIDAPAPQPERKPGGLTNA